MQRRTMDCLSSFPGEAGCQDCTVTVTPLLEHGDLVSRTQKQLSGVSRLWPVAGCSYHGSASSHPSLPHVGSFFVSTIVCIISLFYLTTSKRSEKHYKNYTLIYFHLNMSLGISVRCSIL